jgi:hypothetical protein
MVFSSASSPMNAKPAIANNGKIRGSNRQWIAHNVVIQIPALSKFWGVLACIKRSALLFITE